jgi:hypothetical protein
MACGVRCAGARCSGRGTAKRQNQNQNQNAKTKTAAPVASSCGLQLLAAGSWQPLAWYQPPETHRAPVPVPVPVPAASSTEHRAHRETPTTPTTTTRSAAATRSSSNSRQPTRSSSSRPQAAGRRAARGWGRSRVSQIQVSIKLRYLLSSCLRSTALLPCLLWVMPRPTTAPPACCCAPPSPRSTSHGSNTQPFSHVLSYGQLPSAVDILYLPTVHPREVTSDNRLRHPRRYCVAKVKIDDL